MFEFDDLNYASDEDETSLKPETPEETAPDLPSETSIGSDLFL